MRIKTDFHLHTDISVDADLSIEKLIGRAIELVFEQIAITDHLDCNKADEGFGMYDHKKTFEATRCAQESYRDRIEIFQGVEIGEPHLYVDQTKEVYQLPLDVIIGSTHYVGANGVHEDLKNVI